MLNCAMKYAGRLHYGVIDSSLLLYSSVQPYTIHKPMVTNHRPWRGCLGGAHVFRGCGPRNSDP